ncbi:hypothetical protein [Streptomyces jumonjinensis]|uniref:Uncharacterized protein n=1 Tax=Streptomyces jumonjinensis TaxID=1945 RepID=A0A646KGT3_STRJU|nr:hypothetical protein [Streptomyces jumonjinensis]MQT01271.1 hypothetical protein [Streptomyces jumonjinensis]
MEDSATPTWTVYIDGQPVRIPATIETVRAALVPERRAEFDAEIARTPGLQLAQVLAMWALPPAVWDQIEADFARLEAGDHSGFHPQEDRFTAPDVA